MTNLAMLVLIQILIQSVMETMVPKLVAEDIPLLNSLLSDVFPGIQYTQGEMNALRKEIRKVCDEMYLVYSDGEEQGAAWVEKVYNGIICVKIIPYIITWLKNLDVFFSRGCPSVFLPVQEFPLQCKPDISRSYISRNWIYRGRMLDPFFLPTDFANFADVAPKSVIFFAKSR